MTRYIPEVGEQFTGYVPSKIQLHKITVGSDTTADVTVGETGEYVLASVSRPVAIFNMWTQTATAFTTNVTLTLGDSTSTDRFFADTTINPASTGAVLIGSTGLTVPYVYDAAQDLKVTVGGATVAAGLCNVYIQYAILED
jgi:hypothetical protein